MKEFEDIIYLIACSVNNIEPKPQKVHEMNLEKIYNICLMQRISACIYPAIKNISGINLRPWNISFSKNQKTLMLMNEERNKLFSFMNKNNIWHMPLKGLTVRNYYPSPAMREMSDNDILFDKNFEDLIRKFMKKQGYKTKADYRHINCEKKPCFRFEIHMNLYVEGDNENLYKYYKNVNERLIKDGLNWSFSSEDFYIFQVCHHYNHNQSTGTGLRPLIDTYLYLKNHKLNFEYINAEMEKIGISDFEKTHRDLSNKLLSDPDYFPKLTEKEHEIFTKLMQSSAYGSNAPVLKRRVEELSKSDVGMLRYMFPPFSFFKERHLRFAQHKALLPYYWVLYNYRRIKAYSLKSIIREFKNQNKKHQD